MYRFLHLQPSFYKILVFIFKMAKDSLTKSQVRDIVVDEISKFVSSELESETEKLLKRGKPREEVINMMKNAIAALTKYMWIRKDVWQNDIK